MRGAVIRVTDFHLKLIRHRSKLDISEFSLICRVLSFRSCYSSDCPDIMINLAIRQTVEIS